ncbi:hypothetical protein WL67_20825 [Burkholderia ubonensis]|uniref:phage protein NinX family protein n=1 Tax=Burkholderia ubonensis TaxID=101571 RepID=UPI000758AD6A|nr:phage protein NinX family protein [Burkholderia ubonensis]KWD49686.1 hypothetical protein WL67_20825 [Burkholderia ubonensis]KWD60465.1 hypothetical protein WL66_05405 [Burkholderia ubonensis]
MKVSELTGALLDYWVAHAQGRRAEIVDGTAIVVRIRAGILDDNGEGTYVLRGPYQPSTRWDVGGEIIERERITVTPVHRGTEWGAYIRNCCYESEDPDQIGPTPLVAAMRAFVALKFGDEVEA